AKEVLDPEREKNMVCQKNLPSLSHHPLSDSGSQRRSHRTVRIVFARFEKIGKFLALLRISFKGGDCAGVHRYVRYSMGMREKLPECDASTPAPDIDILANRYIQAEPSTIRKHMDQQGA